MRGLLVVAVVIACRSAYATPGAIAVPPMEAEVGAATPLGATTPTTNSTEVRVGVHWASIAWMPTRADVGVGYTGSYRELPVAYHGASASLGLDGVYFSLAYAIESHRHWRTWIGARVEGLTGTYNDRALEVVGGALRINTEVFAAGAGAGSDNRTLAVMAGTWALGIYVEGTARTLPGELGPVGVGAGVSVRVPLLLAIGV